MFRVKFFRNLNFHLDGQNFDKKCHLRGRVLNALKKFIRIYDVFFVTSSFFQKLIRPR